MAGVFPRRHGCRRLDYRARKALVPEFPVRSRVSYVKELIMGTLSRLVPEFPVRSRVLNRKEVLMRT